MTAKFRKVPSFHLAQVVRFGGGKGIVRSRKLEFGTWVYLIEMPLGKEPVFGRLGAETMIVMNEGDLRAT